MNNGEKLKEYLENKGISKTKAAEILGISRQSLYQYFESDNLLADTIDNILTKLNVSGSEIWGKSYKDVGIRIKQSESYIKPDGVPYYDLDVTASTVEIFQDRKEVYSAKYSIPGFEDCDFALPVYGHSMYPTYENGSVIMCKKVSDKSLIVYGEAYLIVTKDYRMVKRLQRSEIKGNVLACSDNEEERNKNGKKKYEPIEIPIDKILFLYIVKGVIKRNQL